MFCSGTFVLSLVTLVLGAPSGRSSRLSVSLSAPSAVHSLDNLQITANVTNTGSNTLKIVKYANILDDGRPTRSFVITKNGTSIPFTGLRIQFDMNTFHDESFVVLPPSESFLVTHDIAALYDFESAGPGEFTFEPVARFQIMESDGLRPLKADTEPLTITLSGDIAKRDLPILDKRAVTACADATLGSIIAASYVEGQALASTAVQYIGANGADNLFEAYFGANSPAQIQNIFNLVATENSQQRTLNCRDPYGVCDRTTIAYTVTLTTNIYYCDRFYDEVETSNLCTTTTVAARNIRGATTLHEMTHALARTKDIGYGCAFDRSLAAEEPASAANNADNYNCFATEVYKATQCGSVGNANGPPAAAGNSNSFALQGLVASLVSAIQGLRSPPS